MTSPTDAADLSATLRLSVTRLARRMRQHSDAGLTPTQLAALATIERCGPMALGTLAEEEQIGAPTVTKIVDKLHAADLIERRSDPADRRVTRIATTSTGRALLDDVRARKTAWLATRVAALDPTELAALATATVILERLAAPDPGVDAP